MTGIPTTTPAELRSSISAGEDLTVVDVRQPHEFERGHIEAPGIETVNVPLNQLQTVEPTKLLPDDAPEPVVAVCASGNRSAMATQLFTRAGIEAMNLQSGMMGWSRLPA